MKKWIAFLLTLVCLMTTSVPVFAANAEVDVFFDGNGGTFNYYMDQVRNGDFFGDFAESGTKISDKPNAVLTDPVFWDSSREFLGWLPYKLEMATPPAPFKKIPLATEPITSQQALDYVIPDHTIQFVAQWAGDDSDYYSEVLLDGFGGKIPVKAIRGVPGGGIEIVDEETDLCENYLMECEEPICVQIANDYEITGDPVKTGATFEGWIEISYNYVGDGNVKEYKFTTQKLYTTKAIVEGPVPENNTRFVAKWSDVTMQEYYEAFNINLKNEENQVSIKSDLQEVPQGIANQYQSVDAIKSEMVSAALNSNNALTTEKANTVFMDIELTIKNASGEWETVTYDNFPTEGVETVLPYPEGTNKKDFDFVIAHMISAGDKAGEIEILNGVFEEDGIRVKFTSMSPVMIMYQAKNTSDTPTDVAPPKTGDTSNIGLMVATLLISGSALVVSAMKRSSAI